VVILVAAGVCGAAFGGSWGAGARAFRGQSQFWRGRPGGGAVRRRRKRQLQYTNTRGWNTLEHPSCKAPLQESRPPPNLSHTRFQHPRPSNNPLHPPPNGASVTHTPDPPTRPPSPRPPNQVPHHGRVPAREGQRRQRVGLWRRRHHRPAKGGGVRGPPLRAGGQGQQRGAVHRGAEGHPQGGVKGGSCLGGWGRGWGGQGRCGEA
jgi:hypothetical protein